MILLIFYKVMFMAKTLIVIVPKKQKQVTLILQLFHVDDSKKIQREPGLYYKDGSSPQQLLVPPSKNKESSRQYNEKIVWTDFNRNTGRRNELVKTAPIILNEEDRLVGPTTNTRNL